jgi:hypothetical protein
MKIPCFSFKLLEVPETAVTPLFFRWKTKVQKQCVAAPDQSVVIVGILPIFVKYFTDSGYMRKVKFKFSQVSFLLLLLDTGKWSENRGERLCGYEHVVFTVPTRRKHCCRRTGGVKRRGFSEFLNVSA